MCAQRTLNERLANMNILTRRSPAERLPLLGISIGVLLATALTITSINKIGEFQHNAEWVEHTHQVRFDLERTACISSDAQATVDGFLLAGNPGLLTPFDEAKTSLPQMMHSLAIQISDNPSQQQHMKKLAGTIDLFLSKMQTSVRLSKARSSKGASGDANAATDNTAMFTPVADKSIDGTL